MSKKSIMAVLMAAIMMVSSSAVVFAAESSTIEGPGWWVDGRTTSTAVALNDGESVTFEVVMDEPTDPNDTYAAFCVEVTDGTYYYTTTSAGDCWGYLDGVTEIGTIIKDMGKNDAVKGGSYEVTMTRDGNNFTATYVDLSTGEPMFNTLYFMGKDEYTFGDCTVYVMGQVGNGTVTVKEAAAESTAEDAADDAAATDVPKTGVVGLGDVYGLCALATGAVALKKRQK